MTLAPEVHFDPYDPDTQRNPYPVYRMLREHSPVHYVAKVDLWVLSRWDDVVAATKHESLTAKRGISQLDPFPDDPDMLPGYAKSIVSLDPPEHTHFRGLVGRVFSARMRQWQAQITPVVSELIDDVLVKARDREVVDLAQDLALPLPQWVTLDFLGLPRSEAGLFVDWSDRMIKLLSGVEHAGMEAAMSASAAGEELAEYLGSILDGRGPVTPAPDGLLVALSEVRDKDGSGLARPELIGNAIALVLGGLETTGSLISNGLAALFQHPDQLELLRRNETLIDGAIEEMLRYDSPAQGLYRSAVEDVEIGGTLLPAGARVFLGWASANRDDSVYDDPERFDITRPRTKHVAFGSGRHLCIGAALARAEARAAFRLLLERTNRIEPAGDVSVNTGLMPAIHSHHHVPVRLS